MAVEWKVEGKRTAEYRFYPENIKIKPELNGRHEVPDIDWLIKDILERGQIVPVSVRNDGGTPVLIAGFSRWRAISEINKKKLSDIKLQVRCTYVQCSEQDGFLANIAENRFRNDTTALDDAYNMSRLSMKYALTEEQIAAIYFPAAATELEKKEALRFVKRRMALISLSKEAAKAFLSGRMKESAAMAIAKLSEEQQKFLVKGDKKVTSSDIKNPRKKTSKPPAKTVREQLEAVIETGKFPGVGGKTVEASDDLVEFLSRVLGQAQNKIAVGA